MIAPILKFGDLVAKRQAEHFYRNQAKRDKMAENLIYYFTRWVKPEAWPDEKTPVSMLPKCFHSFPLSVIQEGVRRLQEKRSKMVSVVPS